MIKTLLGKKKLLIAIGAGILVLIFIIVSSVNAKNSNEEKEKLEEEFRAKIEAQNQAIGDANSDSFLMKKQPDLIAQYGDIPDGYLWDFDGTLLSKGDPNMSAEEVLYAYINGLKTLDMSSVQRFSRGSSVVKTYSGYFDAETAYNDYKESFMRNMYRDCMLSIQTIGVVNNTVFADNKQVFTVKVSMLDLTIKDFWKKDKDTIYKNLRLYKKDESDDTKGDIYLYDYISRYYESDSAARREVTFDITLEKYPDLESGWLVSIDSDVDAACKYQDGTLVVQYIKDCYAGEGYDYFDRKEETTSAE